MEGFKVQKGRESALLLGEWAYGGGYRFLGPFLSDKESIFLPLGML